MKLSRSLPFAFLIVFLALASGVFAQSRPSVSAAEVNGTFKMAFKGKFKDMSNGIKILALGGGKLRVAMDLIFPYSLKNGEPMVNLGQLDETFSIEGDTATFRSEDQKCVISIRFVKPGTIEVAEESREAACGFGHNVTSSGEYRKTSSKKPTFEPAQ